MGCGWLKWRLKNEKVHHEQQKRNGKQRIAVKSPVTVLSATDSDNKTALCEMPYALEIAVQMAEKLYNAIADAKEMEVK